MLRTFNTLKYARNTIFAVSSGQGRCAVANIRVSGPQCSDALKALTWSETLPKARFATLKKIYHPISKEPLDNSLILWFPKPKSYTGEDTCELHVHGGIAVVNSVLQALADLDYCSLAEPGEFTKRAFFNGKLDLTEVEGLSDLLQAETEYQRKQAFFQSQGSLSKLYNNWKKSLLNSLAHIEAYVDFDESESLALNCDDIVKNLEVIVRDIKTHLSDGRKGELLRNGVKTCIIGEANVGKSSLLNILCKKPAAIVTPIEGTTRDVLEITQNINGYPMILSDTAGLRFTSEDPIEKEGIIRALENCRQADLVLLVLDFNKVPFNDFESHLFHYIQRSNLSEILLKDPTKPSVLDNFKKACLIVCNKKDLFPDKPKPHPDTLEISCVTNEGIDELLKELMNRLSVLCANPTKEHPSMNQLRHKKHLEDCLKCLEMFRAICLTNQQTDVVLTGEWLRKAVRHLEKLVGRITNEDVLDIIFSNFCIGK